MAYEAKFTHSLDALTKDYVNRKEYLKQEIRSVYNELQEVKMSTGYSLDQVRSAYPKNSPYRRPNAPKIYLPPIGVRLVKKYVGVDVKRQSLSEVSAGNNTGKRKSLGDVLNSAFGLDTGTSKTTRRQSRVKQSNGEHGTVDALNKQAIEVVTEINEEIPSNESTVKKLDDRCEVQNERINQEECTYISDEVNENDFQISDQNLTTPLESLPPLLIISDAENESTSNQVSLQRKNTELSIDNMTELKTFDNNKDDGFDGDDYTRIETKYHLQERRSSRSTFRTRNSARLHARSSHLSEHNLNVAGITGKTFVKKKRRSASKQRPQHFYLDYGDGKLHDIMEIPKVKDCSRPWCNPHCKTCINRSTSRPCFVLIRADENIRKRLIPQDKRRLSMFPAFKLSQPSMNKHDDHIEEEDKSGTKETIDGVNEDRLNAYTGECSEINRSSQVGELAIKSYDTDTVGDTNDEKDSNDLANETINSMLPNKTTRKKGFSKKRMDELAMPRGGPPAEVRFSKTSLRRKQEQLKEDERTKALTEYERRNLTYIQGKISVFLALMNEQELSSRKPRPTNMYTHAREPDIKLSTSKIPIISRKKGVRFSPNPRYRLLS
ncbi:hypothetical protein ACF0H5_008348 [Mactra antiquata]